MGALPITKLMEIILQDPIFVTKFLWPNEFLWLNSDFFLDPTIEMFGSLGGSIALTRLMEIIIQVSGTSDEKMEKLYNHFYGKLFKTRLAELAVHPQANFR